MPADNPATTSAAGTSLLSTGSTGSPTLPTSSQTARGLVSVDNYMRLLNDALYTKLGDDRGFGPEHDLARDNIVAELEAAGLDVVLEPFPHAGSTYYNVVATHWGTSDEVLVLGAHFDSVDNPGADDNATGTALVIECARVLAQFPRTSTVHFVLFDREEQGKVGSEAFVAAHSDEDIRYAVTADMIGQDHGAFAYDLFHTSPSGDLTAQFALALEQFGGGLGANLLSGPYSFSDHWSFESAGIPALVIIEADYSANTNYHQPTDAIDLYDGYVDGAYVEGLLKTVVEFLAE